MASIVLFRSIKLLAIVILWTTPIHAQASEIPTSLSMPEFRALIYGISEPGQEFHTDNFISNESSYLHPLPVLHQLDVSNGVYVGVGPEQNFTYIGAIRPQMAFIVDIRRQNMLQHLMYKALFAISHTRADFLSRLLSKPLYEDLPFIYRLIRRPPTWGDSGRDPSIEELVKYFDSVDPVETLYEENLARVKEMVREYGFGTPEDLNTVEYVFHAFYKRQLDIRYDHIIPFPGFRELLTESTLDGKKSGFLADEQKYRYVKDMHYRNLIVPVVGDFSGDQALRGISQYVKERGAIVSVFYTSNVESYLLAAGFTVFSRFIENVRQLPIDESSIFIRSFHNGSDPRMLSHPDRVGDHPFTTLVQPMNFLLEKKPWVHLWGSELRRYIVTEGNLN